jgi:hypothetical protein
MTESNFKNLILPIPRSGNYMIFKELADMLKEQGVEEKLIENMFNQIVAKRTIIAI